MKRTKAWFTGIVHVWDLPEDKVMVDFDSEYKKKMLTKLIQLSPRKCLNSLAKVLGVTLDNLVPFGLRTAKIRLKYVWIFSRFLIKNGYGEFSKEEIEKHITKIAALKMSKEIINPKLPFNFKSIEGSQFISAIYHDGGLSYRRLQPYYVNDVVYQRQRIKECAENIFGKFNTKSSDISKKI